MYQYAAPLNVLNLGENTRCTRTINKVIYIQCWGAHVLRNYVCLQYLPQRSEAFVVSAAGFITPENSCVHKKDKHKLRLISFR